MGWTAEKIQWYSNQIQTWSSQRIKKGENLQKVIWLTVEWLLLLILCDLVHVHDMTCGCVQLWTMLYNYYDIVEYKVHTSLLLYRVTFTLEEWSVIDQISLLAVPGPSSAVSPNWVFSQSSLQSQWYGIVHKILDSWVVTAAPMWSLFTEKNFLGDPDWSAH